MGNQINLAFIHDSLHIFGIGSSLNRDGCISQPPLALMNALCRPPRQEQVTDFVSRTLLHNLQRQIFVVVKFVALFLS